MKITDKVRAKHYVLNMQAKGYINGPIVQTIIKLFNDYRTLPDFMAYFIANYNIPYYEIPLEYRRNVSFLVSVCNNNIIMINELFKNLTTTEFYQLIDNMPSKANLLSSHEIKPAVKNDIRRFLKTRQKIQTPNKITNTNVII